MIPELKPITTRCRTLGWKPTITMRMPEGKLTFTDDELRPGLFAYGRHHDYCIRIIDGVGYLGQWREGLLYDGEPNLNLCESHATVPNATTNQLIRLAEKWEKGK